MPLCTLQYIRHKTHVTSIKSTPLPNSLPRPGAIRSKRLKPKPSEAAAFDKTVAGNCAWSPMSTTYGRWWTWRIPVNLPRKIVDGTKRQSFRESAEYLIARKVNSPGFRSSDGLDPCPFRQLLTMRSPNQLNEVTTSTESESKTFTVMHFLASWLRVCRCPHLPSGRPPPAHSADPRAPGPRAHKLECIHPPALVGIHLPFAIRRNGAVSEAGSAAAQWE